MISQPWVVYALVGVPACAFAWSCLHLRTRAVWALATMATGWALTHGPLKHLGQSEERLNKTLAAHRTSVLNNITLFFSWTGATVSIVGVCLVVVAVLSWRTRQWWFAVVPLIEVASGPGLLLRHPGHRPAASRRREARPLTSHLQLPGHSGAATGLYVTLPLLAMQIRRPALRALTVILCVASGGHRPALPRNASPQRCVRGDRQRAHRSVARLGLLTLPKWS